MRASDITIECDEDGFSIVIDGDSVDPDYQAGRYSWRIDDPEQLYDRVKAAIGPWLRERDEAHAEFKQGVAVGVFQDVDRGAERGYESWLEMLKDHWSLMDRAETIVATRRVAEWRQEDREWLAALPPPEQEIALLLAAHLGARPIEDNEKETL